MTTTVGGALDLREVLVYARVGREPALHKAQVADDARQQVVEVVGDAAGELAQHFHALRSAQAVLKSDPLSPGGLQISPQRDVGRALLRHVAHHREHGLGPAPAVPHERDAAVHPDFAAVAPHQALHRLERLARPDEPGETDPDRRVVLGGAEFPRTAPGRPVRTDPQHRAAPRVERQEPAVKPDLNDAEACLIQDGKQLRRAGRRPWRLRRPPRRTSPEQQPGADERSQPSPAGQRRPSDGMVRKGVYLPLHNGPTRVGRSRFGPRAEVTATPAVFG